MQITPEFFGGGLEMLNLGEVSYQVVCPHSMMGADGATGLPGLQAGGVEGSRGTGGPGNGRGL